MITNERAVQANDLWTTTANPAPDCPALDGEARADVAVVGAGYTGLSAALHLAEAGRRVIVLETQKPGWGASGRNGGQINPGLYANPDAVEARFGSELGARMVRLSGEAGALVFDLIARHGISCDPRPVGWVRAAFTARALPQMRATVDQWARRGAPLRMMDATDLARAIGTSAYHGGIIDPRGGNLHPLNYALGLADAALRAGAVIHGHSKVTALDSETGLHVLHTDRGRVVASRVLICTNAYSEPLVPGLARTIVPVCSTQVATGPLDAKAANLVLPGWHAVSDTRRLLLYFRKDAAGRFIIGGRGAFGDGAIRRRQADLRQAAARLFPALEGAQWVHAWGGFIAMTPDRYPRLLTPSDGIAAALGYNGRGVAMATLMGKVLADWACGTPPADLGFPVSAPRPIPLHRFHRLGVAARVAAYRLMDAAGL